MRLEWNIRNNNINAGLKNGKIAKDILNAPNNKSRNSKNPSYRRPRLTFILRKNRHHIAPKNRKKHGTTS